MELVLALNTNFPSPSVKYPLVKLSGLGYGLGLYGPNFPFYGQGYHGFFGRAYNYANFGYGGIFGGHGLPLYSTGTLIGLYN
jgi:hypothetical protein